MLKSLGLLMLLVLAGCASGNCRQQPVTAATGASAATTGAAAPPTTTPATVPATVEKKKIQEAQIATKPSDRVRVFKYDGSLQCNMGKSVALAEMQKDLKSIQVFSSENKSDSLMRIQQCGTPTGKANVYEIDRKDLDAAKKLGFQLWTFD